MDEFLPVDFSLPLVLLATAVVFLLIGVPLLIHGVVRRKKFARLRDGEQTYALRSSIRTELICSGISGVLMLVLLVVGVSGYNTAMKNLEANILQEYSPTQLDIKYWNGSWATADIEFADGTSYEDATVTIVDSDRPVVEKKATMN